jgi:hypothetical protein
MVKKGMVKKGYQKTVGYTQGVEVTADAELLSERRVGGITNR